MLFYTNLMAQDGVNNAQKVYEQSSPVGLELDDEALQRRTADLDYTELESKTQEPKTEIKKEFKVTKPTKNRNTFWTNANGKNIIYVLVVIAICSMIFFVIRNVNIAKLNVDSKNAKAGEDVIDSDSLNKLDVFTELDKAIANEDYRKAIRILYLKNLKLLMSQGKIRPSAEKTNMDYVRELLPKERQSALKQITDIFEFVWYGQMVPDAAHFATLRNDFDTFYNQEKQK